MGDKPGEQTIAKITARSNTTSVTVTACQHITVDATENMNLKSKTKNVVSTHGIASSGGPGVDIQGGKIKGNS